MAFKFLSRRLVEQMHAMQIERFGGLAGLRDEGSLESALGRPINKANYGCDDVIELAAAYLFGLGRNHAFLDGNKRIAIVSCGVFLLRHGHSIETSDALLYTFAMGIAMGEIDEDGATRFLRDHTIPLKP
jgi:death-on-curing protein